MRYRIGMTVTLALASLAALIAGATATFAQASSSMAELRGQVTDADGAAIANAKLTLTDLVKGSSRVVASDGEGAYVFLGLPPSSYELQVEAQGFSASATRIELTVGRQANIPIKLAAGKIEFQVDVVGGGEVVEVNRTEQASTVDAKQITSLPINRRNFLDYALLTPGADPGVGGFVPCTAPGAVPLADFNLRGRRDRKPTEPLGFTSAADPRQLQFGVRFNF
jgi:Carboxypeptidase regulatory-like domain